MAEAGSAKGERISGSFPVQKQERPYLAVWICKSKSVLQTGDRVWHGSWKLKPRGKASAGTWTPWEKSGNGGEEESDTLEKGMEEGA